jgi:predicted amidohydrolase YtcJ
MPVYGGAVREGTITDDACVALVGGRVHTLDDAGTVAEGIAIDRGRIVSVGSSSQVRHLLPHGARTIELDGRTVLPGMIDAHSHVELSTLAEGFWIDVRACPPEEALERMSRAVRGAAAGEWVIGQGTFGQRLPSRSELDRIAPDNPVLIRQSMHLLVANSPALALAGIHRSSAAPFDARVLRDERGEPNGLVREGFDLFPYPRPDADRLAEALAEVTRTLFVERGVTTIYELPASPQGMHAWQRLHRERRLPCRLTLNPILAPGHQPIVRSLDAFLELGLGTGFGNSWLKLGALKIFVDGGDLESGLYRRELGGSPRGWGIANFHFAELVGILARCRTAGVQVWMHAIGDAAQEMALAAVEEVNLLLPGGDHRTRIEHIGNHVFDMGVLDRMKRGGVIPVPNAVFIFQEEDTLERSSPPHARFYPLRTMIDHGLLTPGNSDCAGTQPFAANPWFGIHSMLARTTRGGKVLQPEERVDVRTAIETYTRHAAFAGFEESSRGSLEAGKLGDLAVYPADPFEVGVDDLLQIAPDLVLVGGRVVFSRQGALAAGA